MSMGMHGDKNGMCSMHQKMMLANSPAERNALVAEHMQSMPPEAREKHLHMMQETMKRMQEYAENRAPAK